MFLIPSITMKKRIVTRGRRESNRSSLGNSIIRTLHKVSGFAHGSKLGSSFNAWGEGKKVGLSSSSAIRSDGDSDAWGTKKSKSQQL